MFVVIGSWTSGNLAYWDGKNFTKDDAARKEYKLERSAVAVARKIKKQYQPMSLEVADASSLQATRIIVAKDGEFYVALPKQWEQLKSEGYIR